MGSVGRWIGRLGKVMRSSVNRDGRAGRLDSCSKDGFR